MTFGTMVTDQELSRMAPIEQELASVFAAELGHASPAEKPVCANSTEAGIDLGLSDLGGMIRLDLEKLLDGRLLFQGTSGAGKSWTLRRILEQTHGLIQQIVIDPEGEFVSLAQHCDYPVLDGSRVDAAARPSRLASSQSVMSNAYSDAPRQHQTSCGASRADAGCCRRPRRKNSASTDALRGTPDLLQRHIAPVTPTGFPVRDRNAPFDEEERGRPGRG